MRAKLGIGICLLLLLLPFANALPEIAHYSFNGNLNDTGIFQLHNGTWINGTNINLTPTYQSGKIGEAVFFADRLEQQMENKYINISNPLKYLNLSRNFTLSWWAYVPGFTKAASSYISQYHYFTNDAKGFQFKLEPDIYPNPDDLSLYYGAGIVPTFATITFNPRNSIQHITVKYNVTHITVFINSTAYYVHSVTTPIYPANDSIVIGANHVLNNYLTNIPGWIDDFRIYNQSLTNAQVAAIYNFGFGTDLPLDSLKVVNVSAYNRNTGTGISTFQISLKNLSGTEIFASNVTGGLAQFYYPQNKSYNLFITSSLGTVVLSADPNNAQNYNFTIPFPYYLNNCSPSSNAGNITLNFTIANEATPTSLLNAYVEVEFNISKNGIVSNQTFILNTSNSYAFCLPARDTIIQASAYFKYTTVGGYTNRYYFFNQNLTNTTTYVSAYNFPDSSGKTALKLNVRDEATFEPLSNVVLSLQRYYTGEGLWRTVQMDKSGAFGENSFNIIERTEDYRFILRDTNNVLLKQTDTAKIICVATPCELTVLTSFEGAAEQEVALGVTVDYDNDTRYMTISWADPEGIADSVRIRVSKETMSTSHTICDTTIAGGTGSTTCNASAYSPPYLLQAITTASLPRFSFTQIIGVATWDLQDVVGGFQNMGFFAGIIMITLGVAGVSMGIIPAAMLLIVGLTIIMFMGGFGFITLPLVAVIAIVTLFISSKIRAKGAQ